MVRMAKDPPAYLVASVDHALRLAVMLQTEGPMRVSDAAARLDVAPSTAHRLLATLVHRDFAVQLPDRRYGPGPALALPSGDPSHVLRAAALPVMQRLVAQVDETVSLAVLRGARCIFIASVEGRQALRIGSRDGATFDAADAAAGRALLALLPEAELAELYPGGAPDLAAVRTAGVALNRDRTEPGVSAVAAAIRDADGLAVAALTISVPSSRFDERRFELLRRAAVHGATEVAAALPA